MTAPSERSQPATATGDSAPGGPTQVLARHLHSDEPQGIKQQRGASGQVKIATGTAPADADTVTPAQDWREREQRDQAA